MPEDHRIFFYFFHPFQNFPGFPVLRGSEGGKHGSEGLKCSASILSHRHPRETLKKKRGGKNQGKKKKKKFWRNVFSSQAKEREIPLVGVRFWLQNENKWELQGHLGLPVTFSSEYFFQAGWQGRPVSVGLPLGISRAKEFQQSFQFVLCSHFLSNIFW